jgi:hypothetical protein
MQKIYDYIIVGGGSAGSILLPADFPHGAPIRSCYAKRGRTRLTAASRKPSSTVVVLRRLRIFGQQDKLRADRSKGRETWA